MHQRVADRHFSYDRLPVRLQFNYYGPNCGLPNDELIRHSVGRLRDSPEEAKIILKAAGPGRCIDYLLPALRDERREHVLNLLIYWRSENRVIGRVVGAIHDKECQPALEEVLLAQSPVIPFTVCCLINALGHPHKANPAGRILVKYALEEHYNARELVEKLLVKVIRGLWGGPWNDNNETAIYRKKAASLVLENILGQ